jgi:hypothetical protein
LRAWSLLVVLELASCGETKEQVIGDSSALAPPRDVSASPSTVTAKAPCPPTGKWSECAVVERLDRAGLAPRLDSAAATESPLGPKGTLLRVGNSELELYIYPDVAARERDQAKLDRRKYLGHDAPISIRVQPTLIPSDNLLAILHSRNDHQRERVADAITAGPPQPAPSRP